MSGFAGSGKALPASALLLALLLLLFLVESPVRAATFTDTLNADFAQGTHENTENVSDDLRLKANYLEGKFTSRVFDTGTQPMWSTLSWNATLPSLLIPQENDNVGIEPTTLVDGTSRVGSLIGGSLLSTRTSDGVYENIGEENVGAILPTYVQTETVYKGGTSGISGAQADDGTYENIFEAVPCYAESLGESTTTSTSYQDKVTLTFTPNPNSTYLIIASWLMQESSTSYQVKAKLTRTTDTAKDFNELIYQPKDSTDYISGGAIGIDSFGSSPGSQTYKIQFCSSNTSGTARIKEARIFALPLLEGDFYAQDESRTTTTSTSWGDKVTLTFAPPEAGDYLILATATADESSTSYDFKVQLTVDGTAYGVVNIEPYNASNRYLWATVKKVNLTAASHTIKIQYCTESSSGTAGIAHARIVALKLANFSNNYYAESEARSTSTSTSYVDKVTLTQTPQAGYHLILACAGLDGASTSYSTYGQLVRDSTSQGEMLIEPQDASSQGFTYFTSKVESLSQVSTTWKVQYKAESSSNAAGIKDARLAVLELPCYLMDVRHEITGIPEAENHQLEIEYYTTGDSEPVSLYLYNFSTSSWDNLGNLQASGSASSPYLFTFGLTGTGYLSGGEVRIRYVQLDRDTVQTSLMVDYARVRSQTISYALRWEHVVENIATGFGGYRLEVKGKTSGDAERVDVYIWDNSLSSWELVGSLTGAEGTLMKDIPSSEIGRYLKENTILIKYESADNSDDTPTTLHVDLCILEEGPLYRSYVKFKVEVSPDGSTWSQELGPDGTPNTYFTSSPASLANIPENRYIRYVAYLSSEHSQLTGANGPRVHDVTITFFAPGRASVFTMEAENVSWGSATLTARLLYVDPDAAVSFRYRRVGTSDWTNTPWQGWQGSWYWYLPSGLQENTWYEFEAQVKYGGQIYGGGIRTFRTPPSKPYATTLKATEVDDSSAVLNARIYYANYDNVSIRFWYQPEGGSWTATPLVSGYRSTTYSTRITGLTANKLYSFKAEITYGSTSENANVETFTTFSSKATGMAYDGGLGFGSYPSGWHGVRMTPPSGTKGLKLELLTSSPSPSYCSLRVVRDNGELLYAGHVLSDNGRSKVVSVRFWKSTAGEGVYVELHDPYGFAYRTKGTKASLGGATYAYSYLDRAGKNLKYYDRACGVNVLEVYT